jgi:hypothetical protein
LAAHGQGLHFIMPGSTATLAWTLAPDPDLQALQLQLLPRSVDLAKRKTRRRDIVHLLIAQLNGSSRHNSIRLLSVACHSQTWERDRRKDGQGENVLSHGGSFPLNAEDSAKPPQNTQASNCRI